MRFFFRLLARGWRHGRGRLDEWLEIDERW